MQTTTRRTQPDIRAIARLIPPSGNLVQGQSELKLHPELARALNDVVAAGLNHYSFFEGVDELRRAVAEKLRLFNGITIDPDRRPRSTVAPKCPATGGAGKAWHGKRVDGAARAPRVRSLQRGVARGVRT